MMIHIIHLWLRVSLNQRRTNVRHPTKTWIRVIQSMIHDHSVFQDSIGIRNLKMTMQKRTACDPSSERDRSSSPCEPAHHILSGNSRELIFSHASHPLIKISIHRLIPIPYHLLISVCWPNVVPCWLIQSSIQPILLSITLRHHNPPIE